MDGKLRATMSISNPFSTVQDCIVGPFLTRYCVLGGCVIALTTLGCTVGIHETKTNRAHKQAKYDAREG